MLQTTSPGRIKDTPVPDGELQVSCFRMGLLVLTALGFFLRLIYLVRISLFVDEFATILAVEGILKQGTPLLPSGLFYEHGLLFSYWDALFAYLFGLSESMVRWPSLFISVLTIPLIYLVGKRMLSSYAGFISAALLTFAWDAIMWGGRARMYSSLGFLLLLALFFLYRGAIETDDRRYRWLFLLSFLGSIFTQAAAILLFPAFLFGIFARRGWRWFIKGSTILEVLAGLGGVWAVFVLKRLAQPGQLETLARVRPYVAPSLDFARGVRPFSPFFLLAERLPMTILLIIGLIFPSLYLLSRLSPLGERIRLSKNFLSPKKGQEGLTFLYSVLGITMLEMIFVVGQTWKSERYLFMVLSIFFLAVAGSLVEWGRLIGGAGSEWLSWLPKGTLLACGIAILASFLSLPRAMEVISKQEWGYDLAFRYLKGQWQPGDRIMTINPLASVVYLGRADFYAIQRDYEEYVVKREGVWIDRWTGNPLLNTVDQLMGVFEEGDRVWFVVDGFRLGTRYEVDFIEKIAEQMDKVYEQQGVMVLLSEGHEPPTEAAFQGSRRANFADKASLLNYALSDRVLSPGQALELTLYWRCLSRFRDGYTVFIHLEDREGQLVAQGDGQPVEELYPTNYWRVGDTIRDIHSLAMPPDLPPGRYRLVIGMYFPQTMDRLSIREEDGTPIEDALILDYLKVAAGTQGTISIQHSVKSNFQNQMLLLGYDLSVDGERITLLDPGDLLKVILCWQALQRIERDYTVFLHLVDADDRLWAQHDGQPEGGFYPTSYWDVGEIVEDEHQIALPLDIPPGEYTLQAGVYLLNTGERLRVIDGGGEEVGDRIILGRFLVGEQG